MANVELDVCIARIRAAVPAPDEDGVITAMPREIPPLEEQAFILAWAEERIDRFAMRCGLAPHVWSHLAKLPHALIVPVDRLAYGIIDDLLRYLTRDDTPRQ